MNDNEVGQARAEAERSVLAFEKALDRLLGEVERGMGRMDLASQWGTKVREWVDVDQTLERARSSAAEFLSELRETAEGEIHKLDTRPVVTWGAVLVSGFVLGYVLAKKTASD